MNLILTDIYFEKKNTILKKLFFNLKFLTTQSRLRFASILFKDFKIITGKLKLYFGCYQNWHPLKSNRFINTELFNTDS